MIRLRRVGSQMCTINTAGFSWKISFLVHEQRSKGETPRLTVTKRTSLVRKRCTCLWTIYGEYCVAAAALNPFPDDSDALRYVRTGKRCLWDGDTVVCGRMLCGAFKPTVACPQSIPVGCIFLIKIVFRSRLNCVFKDLTLHTHLLWSAVVVLVVSSNFTSPPRYSLVCMSHEAGAALSIPIVSSVTSYFHRSTTRKFENQHVIIRTDHVYRWIRDIVPIDVKRQMFSTSFCSVVNNM